jgi:hypothetical protein
MSQVKIKFYDWLWWTIGMEIWKHSARNHSQYEIKRRLGWMTLDCRENNVSWRCSKEGREWLSKQAQKAERF